MLVFRVCSQIHDWHVFFVTDAGKFILYNLLPGPEYKIMCGLINSIRALLRRRIDISGFRLFFTTLIESLCAFEKSTPPTEHAIIFHLLLETHLQAS